MAKKKGMTVAENDVAEFSKMLGNESDRGCVMVTSAYLEEGLRDALIAKCKSMSDVTDKELNAVFKAFDSQFASFASCIRLARAMGIVDALQQKMLLDFGAARNGFAHGRGTKKITDSWVDSFALPNRPQLDDLAEAFQERFKDQSKSRLVFSMWASCMHGQMSRATLLASNQNDAND